MKDNLSKLGKMVGKGAVKAGGATIHAVGSITYAIGSEIVKGVKNEIGQTVDEKKKLSTKSNDELISIHKNGNKTQRIAAQSLLKERNMKFDEDLGMWY
ncbi:hypothetical protein [Macrococcus equi]|uniref:hypothetical protein n=1 Tax=Macrococcus equi TaxID=3395462 RepID=UPI0039BDE9EB